MKFATYKFTLSKSFTGFVPSYYNITGTSFTDIVYFIDVKNVEEKK